MKIESLNYFKYVTAYQFFIEPADNDYLLARWMLINNFSGHFWHVSQSIEKYLKAGLVLNGHSVRSQSHGITKLHKEHLRVFAGLALAKFSRPDGLSSDYWTDETVEEFILRVDRIGSPDSRYGLTSWSKREDDLFKIDQLIWSLRRLTIGLDWCLGSDSFLDAAVSGITNEAYSVALSKDLKLEPLGPIKGLTKKLPEIGTEFADILHSWNFSFLRNETDTSKPIPTHVVPDFGSFRNSHLTIYWEILNAKDIAGKLRVLNPLFVEGMRWLVSAIKLPNDAVQEINGKLDIKRA